MRIRYKLLAVLSLLVAFGVIRADEDFSLVVNPFTGAASLRNDTAAAVELDSYFVTSAANPILTPDAWSSLEDNSVAGWHETFSETGNRLGELNLFESLAIPGNSSVDIGQVYAPFAPTDFGEAVPALSSINFTYTLATESEQRKGDVEFSAQNTVVLIVDPETGDSVLENQSGFDVSIDSYLVKSIPGAIDAEGWTPLSEADDAWRSGSGRSNRIAEGNLFNSTALAANGGMLSIGKAIDASILDDETDLVLEFTTGGLASSIDGGVLFRGAGAVGGDPLDCNGDGVLKIADANCAEDLDGLLGSLTPPTIAADLDGDGSVAFSDFLILSDNFGQPGSYTDGNIDRSGNIDFADFLALSDKFGQSAAATASVPEPNTMALALTCLLGLVVTRRKSQR